MAIYVAIYLESVKLHTVSVCSGTVGPSLVFSIIIFG
jgi:hypothetical protein